MNDDRIERAIEINAPAEIVWDLVVIPGWYINDGTIREHRIERRGEVDVVYDEKHGAFPIRTLKLERPRYAAFRWEQDSELNASFDMGGSTLVEFWIEDRIDGGVTLRVVESGFASLNRTAEERRKMIEENSEGWTIELAAAKTYLES